MVEWKKSAVTAAVVTVVSFVVCYGALLLSLVCDTLLNRQSLSVILIFIIPVIVIGIDLILLVVNKKKIFLSKVSFDITVLISSVIFALLMIFLFPHLYVPMTLIPNRELALDYEVLLFQMFAVGGAAVCGIASLIGAVIHSRK